MDIKSHNSENFDERSCQVKVSTESQSEYVRTTGRNGPIIAMLPVFISNTKINICLDYRVKLDRQATNITNCKGDVYINSCKLLDLGNKSYGKIYLDGYIKESIEYVDISPSSKSYTNGSVRFFTDKIPFGCSARIHYYTPPVVRKKGRFIHVKMMGNEKLSEEECNFYNGQCSSEGMYCELVEAKFLGKDISREPLIKEDYSLYKNLFDTISGHMVLTITIILLQEQLVNIPHI